MSFHFPEPLEATKEKVTLDDKGRVLINGKVASDSAIEQRLRRYCSKRKNGSLKCPQDVYDRFHNKGAEARTELIQIWKDSCLNKERMMASNFLSDFESIILNMLFLS